MTKSKPSNSMQEAESPAQKSLVIRIITHNIRYATSSPFKGEEPWAIRRPLLCSQLHFNSIVPETFVCLQEVLHQQIVDVSTSINTQDDKWAYIGIGRDDGNKAGEYSPVFYRPDVWRLDEWRTRWLSETPDIPSKGWDASSIRIVTIGHFTHLSTGTKIIVMSTHFDDAGVMSRRESAKLILKEIKSMSTEFDVATILLAGDFNSPPEDGAYRVMTAEGSDMEDLGVKVQKERRYGNEMTFTSFGYVDNTPSRIDFVFARKDERTGYRDFGVLANRFDDGVYLSDHRACVADVVLRI